MAKKEITDFGSKIGGARKDVWVKRGLCVEGTFILPVYFHIDIWKQYTE